ncbi:MAG: 30S ribosome-binding factor RbfA [Acidiphilium sp.]|nr:30S ribosome-binding factor RbfA [Acidiphilium sp.]MDD4935060.1 30S ribosome-binding factor RbfA [Acidiphilium sp.]
MLRNRTRSGVAGKDRAGVTGKVAEGPTQRQRRVAEDIRHRLAAIFARTEFRDPDLIGVHLTVAEVRMSPDLKHATVFVSRLGNIPADPLLPALKRVGPFLRSAVGQGMRTKFVPDLHFQPDHALDEATRINRLLHTPEVTRDLPAAVKPDDQ